MGPPRAVSHNPKMCTVVVVKSRQMYNVVSCLVGGMWLLPILGTAP